MPDTIDRLDEYLERRGGCYDDPSEPCLDCGEEDCWGECGAVGVSGKHWQAQATLDRLCCGAGHIPKPPSPPEEGVR